MGYPTRVTATAAAKPQSVRVAVWLMCLGALLSVAGIVVGVDSRESVLAETRTAALRDGRASADVDAAVDVVSAVYMIVVVVGGAVAALLWLWMAWTNNLGRRWARIVATALFACNTVALVTALAGVRATGAANLWLAVAMWLVGLLAVGFLWRRDAGEYYTLMATPVP